LEGYDQDFTPVQKRPHKASSIVQCGFHLCARKGEDQLRL
jgi:hypothetical protein